MAKSTIIEELTLDEEPIIEEISSLDNQKEKDKVIIEELKLDEEENIEELSLNETEPEDKINNEDITITDNIEEEQKENDKIINIENITSNIEPIVIDEDEINDEYEKNEDNLSKKKIKTNPIVSIIAILCGVLIGSTFSYYQSRSSFENVFNTGTYKVISTEEFTSPNNWKPGEEIPITVTTTNEGTITAAVRVKFEEKWYDGDTEITQQVASDSVAINFDNINDWTRQGDYYYYKVPLDAGEETSSFIQSVTLNPNINDVVCTPSQDGKTQTCESTNNVVGSTYKLIITKETVQYDSYTEVWSNTPEIKYPTNTNEGE